MERQVSNLKTKDEAEVKYLRKRLYVTDKAPGLTVDQEGYVRVGLSGEMKENDLVVLGLTLALKNKSWKAALIERVRGEMIGLDTTASKISKAFSLLK
jgi:hypothetical protein